MTNIRIQSPSLLSVSRLHAVKRTVPAVSIALLALFGTTACGSADADTPADSDAPTAEEIEESMEELAEVTGSGSDAADAPDACSLLTLEDIKAVTGREDYAAGEGTDYDNTCRFDNGSDQITVALSDWDDLEFAEPIGTEVVPVDGLPDATRVDAMVFVEKDGLYLTVGTGLPGFAAPEYDTAAAEELAKIAAGRL